MTDLVVTIYKGEGKFGGLHYRLHRADCPVLRPHTDTRPYLPTMPITRTCQRCKPQVPAVA